MRYRLHDADLRLLNTASDSLSEALQSLPLDQFREPERVQRAREDFQALRAKREIYSVARLFRELKEQTNIDWYLSPQERRDLRTLESLIDSFGEGALQPALDESFLDLLSLMESLDDSIAGVQDQAEAVNDAVNIMTVHKSKGLQNSRSSFFRTFLLTSGNQARARTIHSATRSKRQLLPLLTRTSKSATSMKRAAFSTSP